MFCARCGNKMDAGTRFCNKCGAEVVNHAQGGVFNNTQVYMQPQVAPKKKSTAKIVFGIIGGICCIIGLACFIAAQVEINTNHYYTWTRPYTSYEAQVIITRIVGIGLLISGIIDLVLVFASIIYTHSTVQDINCQKMISTPCPTCGIQLGTAVNICPRCKTRIR